MKKVLFIDRDGTLIIEPPDEQVDSLEKLEFYPGVFSALADIATAGEFELVIVTNQDGLGSASFPLESFWPAHNKMLQAFKNEGVHFTDVLIDKSFPHENSPSRKPGVGMLSKFANGEYDLTNSFVIGDRITDIELAKNLGASGILVLAADKTVDHKKLGLSSHCVLATASWREISRFLLTLPRRARAERKTKETAITVQVNLDGTGQASIKTGLGFFDHMLEQLARHAYLDLTISSQGDLHIDEHHTIEDTAITLGEAFRKALGAKRGIGRYGFCLPMDDALAQVAVDFGGRPWLVWETEFKREKIGEMPTEMFFHFFKSFSDAAGCNINIKAEGQNEHHKIEAIFKAFARAVRMAVKKDGMGLLPTTKGTL